MMREIRVHDFIETMKQEIATCPSQTKLKNRQLAVKLIFEELKELAEALDVKDTMNSLCKESISEYEKLGNDLKDGNEINDVEVLDALADIEYTCLWGVVSTGLIRVYDNAFKEVCDSNDSKVCEDLTTAVETRRFYNKEGISCIIEPSGRKYIVKDDNGKVKKSIKYTPVDLNKFFNFEKNN